MTNVAPITNLRIVFLGSRRSSIDSEGRFLIGIGVAMVIQLGDYVAPGNILVHTLSVRKGAADTSGNHLINIPPGIIVQVIEGTHCASESDAFEPFANPSVERRAMLM